MNKRQVIYFFLLVFGGFGPLLAQSPDIRTHAEHDPEDGEIRLKYEFYFDLWSEREVRHGRFSRWASNGQLIENAEYAEDELNGLRRLYYSNGHPRESSWWKEGERHGSTREFDRKGRLLLESNYQSGQLHGIRTTYNEKTGKVRRMEQFHRGQLHGFVTDFNAKGAKKRVWKYEEGKKVPRRKQKEGGGKEKESAEKSEEKVAEVDE